MRSAGKDFVHQIDEILLSEEECNHEIRRRSASNGGRRWSPIVLDDERNECC